jgi:hypothetical protein
LLKDIPNNDLNVNRIIKNYFNLYFSDSLNLLNIPLKRKLKILAKKGRTFTKIFTSNVEIKHMNNKAKIILYVVNREKLIVKNKFFRLNKIFMNKFIQNHYSLYYKKSLMRIYNILNKYEYKYLFLSSIIKKSAFIKYKLQYLNKFLFLKHLYLTNIINYIIDRCSKEHLDSLKKYELSYSLNQHKLSQVGLLPRLSNILSKILNKKIEYNIVNLKNIAYHPDIFTNILGTLIRKKKTLRLGDNMNSILKKTYLPNINSVSERIRVRNNIDKDLTNYNDSKLISNIKSNNLTSLINNYNNFNNKEKTHDTIFNSINYKNLAGLRIEVKGRLTKRYRADRAIYRYRVKGGLRNVYSSYQGLSTVLFRGKVKSNTSYS